MSELIRKRSEEHKFVLGVDLDGCVADFYGEMRRIYSEWSGIPFGELSEEVSYGLPEWGLDIEKYENLHRFAVVQKELFINVQPMARAPQVLRDLSDEGVDIRIITHRLFLNFFHQQAAIQTIDWLEKHWIPYRELCFVKDKSQVDANIYIEDYSKNIEKLIDCKKTVICFTNSTNRSYHFPIRAFDWDEVGDIVREHYHNWSLERSLPISKKKGQPPIDLQDEKKRWIPRED